MSDLPREDQPDEIWVGDVGPIPIHYEDDPRLIGERAAWSQATIRAQALHTADELLNGMVDPDWRVRHEAVDRLVARAGGDNRTLPALILALSEDPAFEVRDKVAMRLTAFSCDAVSPALLAATRDAHPEVRSSATYSLHQLGVHADDEP